MVAQSRPKWHLSQRNYRRPQSSFRVTAKIKCGCWVPPNPALPAWKASRLRVEVEVDNDSLEIDELCKF